MNRRDLLKTLGAGAGGALVGPASPVTALGTTDPGESKPAAARPFGLDDPQRLKFVMDAGLLPDGRHGFYLVGEVDEKLRDRHTLWVFDRESAAARRVGTPLGDLSAPAPSPDGRTFAVLAPVSGKRQVRLVPIGGGTARTLTKLPQGVSGGPVWSPDGRSIAFTAGPPNRRDPSLPYRIDRVTYRFDGLGNLDDAIQDVYVVDVQSGTTRRLTSGRSSHTNPRWSPDSRSLLYTVSFSPDRPWNFFPELHALDVQQRQSHAVVSSWGGVFGAEWCPDGRRIAFVGCRSAPGKHSFAQKYDLWTIDAGGGTPECRTPSVAPGIGIRIQADLPAGLGGNQILIHGDDAYLSGQVAGDVVIYRIGLSGAERVEKVLEHPGASLYLADFDPKSGPLHLASTFLEPPELMLGSKRITKLNDVLIAEIARPNVRKLEVTASDGLETDAWALTPPTGNGPWPTVLYVHGGPYGAFGSTYSIDFHLLAGAGFAVVFHNFRGSGGYGTEFSEKILGKWGPAGSLDHHATLDEAIKAGIADSNRLGVCGLSHGGFATCWLLGNSDRFKAGVAENPVTNWVTSYGVADSEWWIPLELGGTPWEVPDNYREQSPLTNAPKCKTPLLFVIGEADMRCPAVEAEQYYRVLKAKGVPTEMVRLPNSPHVGSWNGPVPIRMAQNEALVGWFKQYLG